jgi:hypothetical protein
LSLFGGGTVKNLILLVSISLHIDAALDYLRDLFLLLHHFKNGINFLIDLSDQIQHLTLHLSEFLLNVPLEWGGIVLDYFGESFLVAL